MQPAAFFLGAGFGASGLGWKELLDVDAESVGQVVGGAAPRLVAVELEPADGLVPDAGERRELALR